MSNRGRFVWEELTTTDTTAAAGFYGKVAGLKTESVPHNPAYTLFVASAGRMGGLLTLGAEAKANGAAPNWLSYISTLNVDETTRQAESLGGKIIKPPAQMGDGGRFAVLQDPQGAAFAVYTPPRPFDSPPTVSLGSTSWHELATSDFNAAFNFYQQLFGWTLVTDMDMPGAGTYRLFAPSGTTESVGGIYTKPAGQPGPPAWLPYIKVADVKPATAKAKALGAQIIHGPADVPGGMITMGVDPQGAAFALHSTKDTKAAPKATKKSTKTTKKTTKPAATKKAAPKKKSAPLKKKKAAKKAKRKAGSKK